MSSASIYVSGFSEATSPADLRSLFDKVVDIESLYIPGPTPTRLKRRFCILRSTSDSSEVAKCVRKLNNCMWKGGTLTVEMASESYEDRIKREKVEEMAVEAKEKQEAIDAAAEPMPKFEGDHLRLKRAIGKRNVGHHVLVSTEQLMRQSNRRAFIMRGNKKHEVLSCGRRLVFEYDEDGAMTERQVDAWGNDIDLGDGREEDVVKEAETDAAAEEQFISGAFTESIQDPDDSGPRNGSGSGVRRGFGTLLPQTKPVKASSRESAAKFQAIMDDADAHFTSTNKLTGLGTRDVNDLVQENEFNEEDMIEVVPHNDEDAHIPAASHEELRDGELSGARDKALALAAALLGGDNSNLEEGTGNKPDDVQKPPQQVRERVFKSGWDTTTIAHYDPSQEDSHQYIMGEQEALQLLEKARQRKAEKEASKLMQSGNSHVQDQDGENRRNVEEEKAGADLDKLKNIFQKDGGMWFGDDGTLKGSVGKGDAIQDRVFLEAEKFGFDIRGPGGGSSAPESTTFGFNFGGDDPSTSINGTGTELGTSSIASVGTKRSASSPNNMDLENNTETLILDSSIGSSSGSVEPVSLLSLFEVVQTAKKFRRDDDKEEDEIVQTWRNTRDKLVVNYKRRKTDARKRSAKYGPPPTAQTGAGVSTGISQGTGRRKSRGGKKHRKK